MLNCGGVGSCHGGSVDGPYQWLHKISKQGSGISYDTSNPYMACSSESKEGFCPHADWSCKAENIARTCSTFPPTGSPHQLHQSIHSSRQPFHFSATPTISFPSHTNHFISQPHQPLYLPSLPHKHGLLMAPLRFLRAYQAVPQRLDLSIRLRRRANQHGQGNHGAWPNCLWH